MENRFVVESPKVSVDVVGYVASEPDMMRFDRPSAILGTNVVTKQH